MTHFVGSRFDCRSLGLGWDWALTVGIYNLSCALLSEEEVNRCSE